jgi:hypothetical protein
VPYVSQGTTCTWGAVTLGEVTTVSVDGISADTVETTDRLSLSRIKSFRVADVDYGTVSLTLRGTAGMAATNVGVTATLTITGPGVSWSFSPAMYQGMGWSAGVGELQAYNLTFKLG